MENASELLNKLKKIRAIGLDMDGVLTDGALYLNQNGNITRQMSVYDGYAIQRAVNAGLLVAIFTGGNTKGLHERFQKLNIHYVYDKLINKKDAVEEFLTIEDLNWENLLYVGDDLPDKEVLDLAGVAVAPPNASQDIKASVDWITRSPGGKGCVREVIEMLLKIKMDW